MKPPSKALLRSCLAALVDALDRRAAEDLIRLDLVSLRVKVDSRLEDVDARVSGGGILVMAPDGLFEWRVRRDFVRAQPAGPLKNRLGDTLGGPKTRRRFEVVLASARGEELRRAFVRFRRLRLRAYAARVIRHSLAMG